MATPRVVATGASGTGWYIAVLIYRFEFELEDSSSLCDGEESVMLIKADSTEEAYLNALDAGKVQSTIELRSDDGRLGRQVFLGLSELLPVYEPFEDRAEILWTSFESVRVEHLKAMVKPKADLGIFRQ